MNIKDEETARLAAEVAALAGESKTRAVRVALEERKRRLELAGAKPKPKRSLLEFLEQEIWPHIPPEERGQPPMTKAEREAILGIGPEGF